jgi:hypothetical protein
MLRKLDRIAIVVVSGLVGLMAVVPGWQIMTDGSVYGFKLPADWLTNYWPFGGYFMAGLLLLVVIGGGCIATAAVNAVTERAGVLVALVMGFVLIGWIGGELIFMTQTMVMTWIILACGVILVALSAPYSLPELSALAARRRQRQPA